MIQLKPKMKISLKNLIFRFKWRVLFTFSLVVLESLIDIFYPLLIGYAINDLLASKYDGIFHLAGLGLLSLTIGSARRFYDTRIYSSIFCQITPEIVENEQKKGSSVSKITARSNLLTEFVEFLEFSMPAVISAIISLVGILIITATLNLSVFYACLGVLSIVLAIYAVTGKFNLRINTNLNNELEKEVETLESQNIKVIKNYYKSLMNWHIKLSDLETANYLVIWLGIIALFIYTPIAVIDSGIVKYGLVFSILMYVFDYIEKVVTFPYFIQQIIRLKEISNRLLE